MPKRLAGVTTLRYRSKPTEVVAVRVTEANLAAVTKWCGGKVFRNSVQVPTINGDAYANVGHYVVKGPNDFYPCDPDTFASRWEAI